MPERNKAALRGVWDKEISTVTCDPAKAGGESVFVCTRTPLSDAQYAALADVALAKMGKGFMQRTC